MKINTFNNFDLFAPQKVVSATAPPKKAPFHRKRAVYRAEDSQPVYIGQNIYIRPTYIISLPEWSFPPRPFSDRFLSNMKNLRTNSHGGAVSAKADKKIRHVINWLLLAAEKKRVYRLKDNSWFDFKINFITLTLPDTQRQISEPEFKQKLLNPFLVYARRFFKLKNYVWKIEYQQNGKLHLHLTSDTFIHHVKLRKCWNHILGANGFLADFSRKHGHANPNSTDVHSVRKIKNLAGYLCKYMAKQESVARKTKGRIWGCNYELSRALNCSVHLWPDECGKNLHPLMRKNIYWEKMQYVDKISGEVKERGEMFYLTAENWIKDVKGLIKENFNEKLMAIRNIAHDGTFFKELNVV